MQRFSSTLIWKVAFLMRDEYDFSNTRKNPYSKQLKEQITINEKEETNNNFKERTEIEGPPSSKAPQECRIPKS